MSNKRKASHAGSWYSAHGPTLAEQLEGWLAKVDESVEGVGKLPPPGARVIIAPHAGYAFSGPAAAWAYKSLDLSQAKRIFLLGPSHHFYLSNCALSTHAAYSTPLGDLPLDSATISILRATNQFQDMDAPTDADEHSLEMHLPYIYHLLSKSFSSAKEFPPLVPILVGNTKSLTEKSFGALLAPYLAEPSNVFIVSSDFCHWGSRFSYTYYLPATEKDLAKGKSLKKRDTPSDPPVYESIERVDRAAMQAVESGEHDAFLANLRDTGNTVCGRHPIGIIMAAIEVLKQEGKRSAHAGRFRFVRYERSSEVEDGSDSSVSYASAFAVI